MPNKIHFLRFFAALLAVCLLVLPAHEASAQSQRASDAAAPSAPKPGPASATPKGGGQAARPAQAPAKPSQAVARPGSDRKASETPAAGRRDGKPLRKGKPRKPRAAEETPGSAPRHNGPTMTAGAAALGGGAVGGAALAAGAGNQGGGMTADAANAPRPPGAGASVSGPQASIAPSGPTPASRPSMGEAIGLKRGHDPLALQSSVAFVVDARSGEVLLGKNPSAVLPIASITKLMTAMVVLDAGLPLGDRLQIGREDIDRMRHTGSRLHPGARLTRGELLQLALMASENRAANALGRHYPGGMPAFVAAMNAKARSLGMQDSRFVEPTGLSSANVASARDLARLVRAAAAYPVIRQYSTARSMTVKPAQEALGFYNTNRLISTAGWAIGLQKTGFISEAGNCLVMLATIDGRPTIVVLLDAAGKLARFDDAQRIRGWLVKGVDARNVPRQRETGPAVAPLRVSHEAH